jgi:hypothetical protein
VKERGLQYDYISNFAFLCKNTRHAYRVIDVRRASRVFPSLISVLECRKVSCLKKKKNKP